jgi:hypothetical protein
MLNMHNITLVPDPILNTDFSQTPRRYFCKIMLLSAREITQLPANHTLSEVGKLKIVYLLSLSLPSAGHVGDIVYLKKRVPARQAT